MIQFRFYCSGMAPKSIRNWLSPAAKSLKHIFDITDIQPGMFSPSITKRLLRAKKHGTKIVLRTWRGRMLVGVTVLNKEDHKKEQLKRKQEIKSLKKKLKAQSTKEVEAYLKNLSKLGSLSNDFYLKSACACIFTCQKELK